MSPSAEKQSRLTAARLRELMTYEPETGRFRWNVRRQGVTVGQIAGSLNEKGYRIIIIDGCHYRAHRLAWLYIHDEWPELDIDHRNGCRDDNSIGNLRLATRAENLWNAPARRNNKSGIKGVCPHPGGYWQGYVTVKGKHYANTFKRKEDAIKFVRDARQAHHGEFVNHGGDFYIDARGVYVMTDSGDNKAA